MFQWLKNFLKWQEREVKDINGLANYVLRNWWQLFILVIVN